MIQLVLDYFIAGDDKQLVLVVKDHAERYAFGFEDIQVAAIRSEYLYAFDVADKHTTLAVHGYCLRGADLPGLLAVTAEARHEPAVGRELENAIVECSQRVVVPQTINGNVHVQLRIIT